MAKKDISQKKVPVKEAKSGEIQRLKSRIKKLEKEKSTLERKIRGLESYREETHRYIGSELENIPLEKVIENNKNKTKLKDVTNCPKCGSDINLIPSPSGTVELCLNQYCDHRRKYNNEEK